MSAFRRLIPLVAATIVLFILIAAPFRNAATAEESGPKELAGDLSPRPGFLTGGSDSDAQDIALDYLRRHQEELGLSAAEIANLTVRDRYSDAHNGVTHLYLQQKLNGLEIINATAGFHVAADGSLIALDNQLVAVQGSQPELREPRIGAVQAVHAAARQLGLGVDGPLDVERRLGGPSDQTILSGAGLSLSPIPARLVYQPARGGALRLAWDMSIQESSQRHWWSLRIDAETGQLLEKSDWADSETYQVFPLPVESPLYSSSPFPADGRISVTNPADTTASPFGWHDTNGVAGAEHVITRGNNAFAYENGNNSGFSPNCGVSLDCTFPITFTDHPDNYESAAIANLFYWNNVVHDVWYQYGFDEASGNFQANNYGNGGSGGDHVEAQAQDSSGSCNAQFFTPPDGSSPIMKMFLCDNVSPPRDGDLDNGVIIHEYWHGISTRLTGGPSTVSCLENDEQMGEGWSDFGALVMTIEPGDTGGDSRGIGNFLFGQTTDGPGIRPQPYSTNLEVNNVTYGGLAAQAVPHGVGWVWATMLWDMTWALIDNGVTQSGFDPDLYSGSGGNNLAMQLVIDGLKLQPCSPGFVDGRDAILQADLVNNGGANQCLIWESFARRGLGYSADQGISGSAADGTEAFDLPPVCDSLFLTYKTSSSPLVPGDAFTYTLVASNRTAEDLSQVTVTSTLPVETSYVPDSASDGGTVLSGIVTFPAFSLNTGAAVSRTFQAALPQEVASLGLFFDDFEGGIGSWTGSGLWNLESRSDSCGASVPAFPSGSRAVYFGDDSSCTYAGSPSSAGTLTMNMPIPLIGDNPQLSFWSYEVTEDFAGFDRRFVEISVDDGSSWTLLRELAREGEWYQAIINLSAYRGQSVMIRFRFDSIDNQFNEHLGWMLDDIRLDNIRSLEISGCATAVEGSSSCVSAATPIEIVPVMFGQLSGTITDAQLSTPISGAVVSLENPGYLFQATTGASGEYSFTLPVMGYQMMVTATGYLSADVSPFEPVGGTRLARDVALNFIRPSFEWSPASVDEIILIGERLTRTITVQNQGFAAGELSISKSDEASGLWLGMDAVYSRTVPISGSLPVTLRFDLREITAPGRYTEMLLIDHNDPRMGRIEIPITVIAAEAGAALTAADTQKSGLPGESIFYTVRLTNTGSATDTFGFSLLDSAWETAVAPGQASLSPGEGIDLTIGITVPADSLAGAQDSVKLTAQSQLDPRLTVSMQLSSTTTPMYEVGVDIPTREQTGETGQVVTYTMVIGNEGNISDTFDISAAGIWTVNPTTAALTLAPGESAPFTITVAIPEDAADLSKDATQLTIRSRASEAVSASLQLTTTARISSYAVYLPMIQR